MGEHARASRWAFVDSCEIVALFGRERPTASHGARFRTFRNVIRASRPSSSRTGQGSSQLHTVFGPVNKLRAGNPPVPSPRFTPAHHALRPGTGGTHGGPIRYSDGTVNGSPSAP